MNLPLAAPCPRSVSRRHRGQSLTELAILTLLVAVGTIGVVGLFGDNLRHLFGSSADAVAGDTSAPNGGTPASAGLLKWSLKGSGALGGRGNPGGTADAQPAQAGDPGGTSNRSAHPGGPGLGNPGGTANVHASDVMH